MIYVKDDDGHEAVPTPELAACIVAINVEQIADRHGYDLRLTGALDRPTDTSRAGRNAWSNTWHPWGLAWDYALVARAGTAAPTQGLHEVVASELRTAVGKLFDVVAKLHGTGTHIHIEYDIKGRLK